jgi:hypothetical protein
VCRAESGDLCDAARLVLAVYIYIDADIYEYIYIAAARAYMCGDLCDAARHILAVYTYIRAATQSIERDLEE